MSNVVDFQKWDATYRRLFVERLLREYVAAEITRELQNGSLMAVRVLGEVLAGKPGFSEDVCSAAATVVRELLEPTKGK